MPPLRLDWMPKAGRTRGQQMYKRDDCKTKQATDAELPHNKQAVGKCGVVNRTMDCIQMPRGWLNGLARRTKSYSKTDGGLILSIAPGAAEIRLDLTYLHVLRISTAPVC